MEYGITITKENAAMFRRKNPHRKRTTKGWKICVEWADGSTSWEPLIDMKTGYPIETAEYAIRRGLETEPAFAWLVGATHYQATNADNIGCKQTILTKDTQIWYRAT